MKEHSKRQTVIVGLFVAFAVVILIGGILMIGSVWDTFTPQSSVSVVFDNVGGLKPGDNVWFSGVKVGTVKKLQLLEGSQVRVDMKVERDITQLLPGDAQAKIGADGLIGNRIVVLYGGSDGAPPLADGAVLQAGTSVSTEDIMAMLQENNANVKEITGKLARGEGTLGKLLTDDAIYTDARSAVASLNSTADSAAAFASKLDKPGTLPHQVVSDRTTWTRVQSAVGELEQSAKKTSDVADRVAASTANERTPVGTLLHDEETGRDIRETVSNLKDSSARLEEDLTAAQSNFLLRHYFKKLEKEKKKAAKEAEKEAKREARDRDGEVAAE